MYVWVATIAVGDSHNDPASEFVGVFSSEEKALEVARSVGPRTAQAERAEVDTPQSWVPWMLEQSLSS